MPFSDDHVIAAVRHLRKRDRVLARVIDAVGPFQLTLKRGRFQTLVQSIVSQQISTAVARAIARKLEARLAPQKLSPENLAQLSFDDLRSVGLSRQKATYLQDLTEKVLDGTVRLHRVHRLTDDEIIDELIQVKGIGRWTVQMFLIFCLGRPDVFAPDDFGLRSAIQKLYGLPDLPKRAEAEEIATPWRPHATVASWYLWRSLELPRK